MKVMIESNEIGSRLEKIFKKYGNVELPKNELEKVEKILEMPQVRFYMTSTGKEISEALYEIYSIIKSNKKGQEKILEELLDKLEVLVDYDTSGWD